MPEDLVRQLREELDRLDEVERQWLLERLFEDRCRECFAKAPCYACRDVD